MDWTDVLDYAVHHHHQQQQSMSTTNTDMHGTYMSM
jgi:hypothetical protein